MIVQTETQETFRFTVSEVLLGLTAVARKKGLDIPIGTMTINGTLVSGNEGNRIVEIRVVRPSAVKAVP